MQQFTQYLQAKDLTNQTQKSYLKSTQKFLDWYESKEGIDPMNCTEKDILDFLAHLKNTGNRCSSTRNSYLNAIKNYFSYLQQENLIAKNPTTFIKIRGIKRKFLYHILSSEELIQLCDDYHHNFIVNYKETGITKAQNIASRLSKQRNHIIVQLLCNQGLVTSEIARLTLDDVDFNRGTIHIKGTKKSNARNIVLQASQIGMLMHYIHQIRPKFLEHYRDDSPQLFLLFPEIEGTKREVSYNYQNLFLKLTKELKTLHPNFTNFKQIRASVITYWIKNLGLRKAQYLAGHRYISSTETYQVNDLESLTEDIAKHHPF